MRADSSITLSSSNQFSIDSKTVQRKSADKGNKFILFQSFRTSSAKSTQKPFHFKHTSQKTNFPLTRNPTVPIISLGKQLTSILLSNKVKLNAFSNFIDDIYSYNSIDLNIKSSKEIFPRPSSSTPVLRSVSTMKQGSKPKKNQKQTLISKENKRNNEPRISKLLAANLNIAQLRQVREYNETKKAVFKKKSSMNRFILKVLDPDANLDDYTCEKGNQVERFVVFKRQLNQEKLRLTNLVNDVKKAQIVNEAWLKLYTVRLKSKNSKYLRLPLR